MRSNHRLIEARFAQLTDLAHMHVADEGQAIDARHQRAQMIRQIFRQHRNDAIWKVHRRSARTGFEIERAAIAHIVADIGDGHDQPPAAAAGWLREYRIIEIPGILTVDGDQRHGTQVFAADQIFRLNIRREPARRSDHFGGKFLRQIVSQNGKSRRQVRRT